MHLNIPSPSTSIFRMPSASRSSLSHSTKVRSGMAPLPIGITSSSRSARDDEAADMLREMARESRSISRASAADLPHAPAVGDRARPRDGFGASPPPPPPQIEDDSAPMVSSERPKALPTSRIAERPR